MAASKRGCRVKPYSEYHTMETVVEATGIGKKFGNLSALKDISFQIGTGEVFGFIGPDGAGKTTLFRIITSLMIPDEGKIKVLGHDPVTEFEEIRKHIGYMPGRFSLYQDLSVEENLRFYATVFGTTLEENYHLIRDIYSHIEPFKKRLAGKLSGGMKQKLALSCALIHQPRLLVLDEPTTGVDAVSRSEFWDMLKNLRQYNITIVVSTPYMDEAMRCDRVALIQDGQLLQIGSPGTIRDGFSRKLYSVTAPEKYKLLLVLKSFAGTESVFPFGDSVHLTLKEGVTVQAISGYLEKSGVVGVAMRETNAGIEDRFLELMNRK